MEPWQIGIVVTLGVVAVSWCIRIDRMLAGLKYMHENAEKYSFGTVEQTKILAEVSKTLVEINESLIGMARLQGQQTQMLIYINQQMGHPPSPPIMGDAG